MNSSGSLGTVWQRGYRRHRLLLDAGGCPSSSSGLKENSPSSRQPGRLVLGSTCAPKPGARGHTDWHTGTHARTHTLKHTRTLPLMFSIGVWVQSCVLREAELKRTGLPWRLGRSARLSWRLPRWTEGKEEYHPPLRVVSPVSEKISAKRGLPDAFGICLLSGAEKSVLGVVVNLGHLGSPATCFAQFSMEPWTHRAPGPSAFSPPFLLLSF